MSKKSRYSQISLSAGFSVRRIVKICIAYFVAASLIPVVVYRFVPVPTSTFMLYRHYEDLLYNQTYETIDYQWVNPGRISPNAAAAVIASEDQLFYEHFGFDLKAIKSAANAYINGSKKLRGASTITQQVAKNLFLTPAKSFFRKGLEAWFTLLIEIFWSKDRIMGVYLNIAEFGDHLFGIEAASQRYFNTSAKNLSRAQAAILAANLPNPLRLKADKPSAYVNSRQNWILRQMRN
ncbi:MAG: monofunctional biosynthetic peptidoglycan transglycosylase [Methylococcales bacterium]|nr:monofunctional biosynthetic peptidoglycan transglycosylase [Methylococcales bacterium]